MAMPAMLITPLRLAESFMKTITGYPFRKPEIMNIHDTCEDGDMAFTLELEEWEDYINTDEPWYHKVRNVLHYYKYRALMDPESDEWTDSLLLQVLKQSTIGEYNRLYGANIQQLDASMDLLLIDTHIRICFYPTLVTQFTIQYLMEVGPTYGQKLPNNKEFKFFVDNDEESEVSTLRLHLLRKVTENLLVSEGYGIRHDTNSCDNTFIFTTNKLAEPTSDFKPYVCGAACRAFNSKLTNLSQADYVISVTNRVRSLWEQKWPAMYINLMSAEADFVKIAFAAMYRELLSEKFDHEVVIRTGAENDHIKEASFCLYTNARLAMTIDIYSKFVSAGFAQLMSLTSVMTFNCAKHIPTWYLIYNYIVRFPDITDFSVSAQTKLEVNIQLIWTFTINLCQDLNKYFIREKILTNKNEVNVSVAEAMEKVYIFTALRTVLKKAFTLLELQEIVYQC